MLPTIDHERLFIASQYARNFSGCCKVTVGSAIYNKADVLIAVGANKTYPSICKTKGCLRVEKYGDDSKSHRNPEDCRAIHSEINAIGKAAMLGLATQGGTIYVTRYPCEACARAIVCAGIKRVIYGRQQEISDQTYAIFERADVEVIWVKDFVEEDTLR